MQRFIIICLLCASALAEAAPPTQVQAHYDVLKGDIRVATITETFARTRDRYRIESVSKAVGLFALFKPETIRVTSEGLVSPHGLRPVTFISTRQLDKDRNTRADFDWSSHHITLLDRAGMRVLPLRDGTQDRLSAMYQFMFLPIAGMKELRFDMTNGSKVDDYRYAIAMGQSVTVPLGTFDAAYVASPREPGASRTEIWLALSHANFPYKMVITEPDGGKFTQVLTQFSIAP